MKNYLFLILFVMILIPTVSASEELRFRVIGVANNSVIAEGGFFNINVTYSGFNFTSSFLNITNNLTLVSNLTDYNMTVQTATNTTTVALNDANLVGEINRAGFGANSTNHNVSIVFSTTLGGTADVYFRGVLIGTLSGNGTARFDGIQTKINATVSGTNNLTFVRTSGLLSTVTITSATHTRALSIYNLNTKVQPVNGTYFFEHVIFQGGVRFTTGIFFVRVGGLTNPVVSLVSPLNGSTNAYNFNTLSFSLTDNDSSTAENCSLSINGVLNQSLSVIPNAGLFVVNQSFNVGNYSWVVNCTNIFGKNSSSGTMLFIIAPQPSMNQSTIFTTAVCPNASIPDALIFMFVGAFLLALLLVNMMTLRIPVLNLMVGLGLVFYSFTMFGCSTSMGIIVFAIGLMVMASTMLVSK